MIFYGTPTKLAETLSIFSKFTNIWFRASQKKGVFFQYLIFYLSIWCLFGVKCEK